MKTIFSELFGKSPMLKVLDFLIINEEFDYSMTDIAKLSGIGYSTLKKFWKEMEKQKLVVHTRTVGKAKMYRLNSKNKTVKKFKEFYWEITKQKVREELQTHKNINLKNNKKIEI